jgi:glucose/mannose transport system substrate-binding protein
MRKKHLVLFMVLAVALMLPVAVFAGGGQEAGAEDQLEIFSWWTAGGEAEGLQALFDIYNEKYPDVEVINATVAGGAGAQAKAVLASRMQGGNPPDSFQVHAGQGIIATWVVEDFMEPVTFILEENGWMDDYPEGVKDIISYQGEIYSIPVNIHRSNVMWYNKAIFDEYNLDPPDSLSAFFDVAEKLESEGVTALALGGSDGWEPTHLLESVLLAGLGPDAYRGLWTGDTAWDGSRTREALTAFTQILEYVNRDQAAITNIDAAGYVAEGRAAMTVMGDWVHGYYLSIGLTPNDEYGWIPFPGTAGNFLMLSDTFGLPKDVPNPENVRRWLTLIASREGQDAFNPVKGSIPARTDADRSLYDEYLLSAMDDFETDEIVPSVAHGAAASEAWVTRINDVVNILVTDRNVDRAAREFQQLADQYAR